MFTIHHLTRIDGEIDEFSTHFAKLADAVKYVHEECILADADGQEEYVLDIYDSLSQEILVTVQDGKVLKGQEILT